MFLIRIKRPYCLRYDKTIDNFNHYKYIYPCILMITIFFHINKINHPFYTFVYSYSIWLESVAIIPQLWLIYKRREVEVFTLSYLILLGLYRMFYVINWIF